MIKFLLLAAFLIVALFLSSASAQPRIEIINETVKITAPEGNASFPEEKRVELDVPEIRLTSYVQAAECRYPVLNGFYTIKRPEYYIFDIERSGKDCLCPPDMKRHSNWSSPMFGQLYQPSKNLIGAITDRCQVTFCYSSGMVDLGRAHLVKRNATKSFNVQFVIRVGEAIQSGAFDENKSEIQLNGAVLQMKGSYDCEDPRMFEYNGAVKSSRAADPLFDGIYYSDRNFKYRIENRDEVVKNLEEFLASSAPGCSVEGKEVVCRKQFSPEIEAYVDIG